MIFQKFLQDTNGATAIEYGLIAAGIGLSIVAAVFAFGGDLATLYAGLSDATSYE